MEGGARGDRVPFHGLERLADRKSFLVFAEEKQEDVAGALLQSRGNRVGVGDGRKDSQRSDCQKEKAKRDVHMESDARLGMGRSLDSDHRQGTVAIGAEGGNGSEETARVIVPRAEEDVADGAGLDNLA